MPKVYLRPFTRDGAGRAINVFNVDRQRLIRDASVRHQCSGSYFYGEDYELDEAIQFVERSYGSVARKMIEKPTELSGMQQLVLKRFWLLQYLRTEAAAKRAVEMNATMCDEIGVNEDRFRLNIRDAVRMAMMIYAEQMGIVDDLEVCVLRNNTDTPFLTSDDPAVASNWWHLLDKRTRGSGFGLGSAGLVFFLPISPRLLCLGYDGDVYNVPSRSGFLTVRSAWDVKRLNEHQYLNCRANLFVQSAEDGSLVAECFQEIRGRRPQSRWKLTYAVRDESNDVAGYERFVVIDDPASVSQDGNLLIHHQGVHPSPSAWPRLLRWQVNGRVFTNGSGVGYVRRQYAEREDGFWKEPARGSARAARRRRYRR